MTGKSDFVDQSIQEYIISQTVHEDSVQRALREETSRRSNSGMQIGPDQAQFMQLLAHTIGARRYLVISVVMVAANLVGDIVLILRCKDQTTEAAFSTKYN